MNKLVRFLSESVGYLLMFLGCLLIAGGLSTLATTEKMRLELVSLLVLLTICVAVLQFMTAYLWRGKREKVDNDIIDLNRELKLLSKHTDILAEQSRALAEQVLTFISELEQSANQFEVLLKHGNNKDISPLVAGVMESYVLRVRKMLEGWS